MAEARPFFEDLGRTLGDREIVLVPGNHDHALVRPWLEKRSELADSQTLTHEQRLTATQASPMVGQLAQWTAPARLTVAYPGLWVRADVYATHGHYLDCHLTIPTMERLGIGAMSRMLHRPAQAFSVPEDYEAVMAPVFAWIDAVAQHARTGSAFSGHMTARAWRALARSRDRDVKNRLRLAIRTRLLAGAFKLAVVGLNRAGLGPFNADVSRGELRRASLQAMGQVTSRLGLGDAYVILGHTHRAGPLPSDSGSHWTASDGARLINAGCWTYDRHFLTPTPGESPYWPGGCVLINHSGPPVLCVCCQISVT